jgi:hypothetical protein
LGESGGKCCHIAFTSGGCYVMGLVLFPWAPDPKNSHASLTVQVSTCGGLLFQWPSLALPVGGAVHDDELFDT